MIIPMLTYPVFDMHVINFFEDYIDEISKLAYFCFSAYEESV